MPKLAALVFAAAVVAPTLAIAQGAFPAPRGHRQPTAADVPDGGGTRIGPAQAGRSAGHGAINDLDNASDRSPRICTNCDD